VFNFIRQLKQYGQRPLFYIDKKLQKPLLNNDEILDLLHRVQNIKETLQLKHDIAFRKMGDNRSIYRGQGMDYEESRRYQPGDDPRYMNWQLSARTGQHYMKVFREERQPGVFILVDRRYSMRFGTQQRLKITQAARTAAIAAFSAQENNFSIGGVILDNELEWFKEKNNKQAVFDFIHQAARPALPVFSQSQPAELNLDNVLHILNQVLTAGSTIYLISDFHDINKSSQSTLLQLASSHKVHAIHITDPAEIKLPKAGALTLKPVKPNKQYNIDSDSLLEQENYESTAMDYFSLKKHLFESIAITYQQILTTDEAIEHKIIF
jgi:uncharacterized protein (DUF58 family)